MKELLKNKQFLLLNLGQFVSLIGTEMQDFALALYVLNVTGSGAKYASIISITVIPNIVFGPILSVFSDRLDKRKIIVISDILSGLVIFSLWGLLLNNKLSLGSIYISVFLLSTISCLFNPTMGSILPLMVKKDEIVEANSINSFLTSSGCVLAPIIAGILLGIFDISAIVIINSVSFFISAFTEVFLKIPKVKSNMDSKFTFKKYKEDFVDGLRCIKEVKILKYIVISCCVINLVQSPALSIGFPYVAKTILKISDTKFGAISSIVMAASFLSPIVVTIVSKKTELHRIFINCLNLFCVISILFIVNSSNLFLKKFKEGSIIPVIFLCLNVGAIILVTYIDNITLSSLKQKLVPLDIQGRVSGINTSISMAMIPLGQMIYGILFDKVIIWIPFTITAIVLGILSIVLNRKITNIDIGDSNERDEVVES